VCLLLQYLLQSCSRGGGGGLWGGGPWLGETKSRGQCELVCPSRTSERGGEGYCVKGGGGEEGERERERAGRVRLHYSLWTLDWILRLIRKRRCFCRHEADFALQAHVDMSL
jgi:hypothetical protein